jgi:2,4-dienoyl-CoA reductase-like NADH-dependent reductase (Old Yellow Enzyme family)
VNEDKFIAGLKKLADIIHEGGAKAAMQMSIHQGSTDEPLMYSLLIRIPKPSFAAAT